MRVSRRKGEGGKRLLCDISCGILLIREYYRVLKGFIMSLNSVRWWVEIVKQCCVVKSYIYFVFPFRSSLSATNRKYSYITFLVLSPSFIVSLLVNLGYLVKENVFIVLAVILEIIYINIYYRVINLINCLKWVLWHDLYFCFYFLV